MPFLQVNCAQCETPLEIFTTPPVRYFLCPICEATTFLPANVQQGTAGAIPLQNSHNCPMCGSELSSSQGTCRGCGEPVAIQSQTTWSSGFSGPVAVFTRVNHSTITWYQWGCGIIGIWISVIGFYTLISGSIGAGLLMLAGGLGILFRRIWILGLLMLILTLSTCLAVLTWMGDLLWTLGFGFGRPKDICLGTTLVLLMILVNVLGWKVYQAGRRILQAGFPYLIRKADLPIGKPLSSTVFPPKPITP